MLYCILSNSSTAPSNGCSHTCLEPILQKVSLEHQGLGSINYINSYYCLSPQCPATLLQVTYPTHLFLPLSHCPHFVLMLTSLPTSPQEHSFLICLLGVWHKLLFTSHVPQVFLCCSPMLLLRSVAECCPAALSASTTLEHYLFLYARLQLRSQQGASVYILRDTAVPD